MSLTPGQIAEQHAWASGIDACTCPTTYDGDRYVVDRHTCPHCRAWDKHMSELGVSATPRPVEEKKAGKRKYRSAA